MSDRPTGTMQRELDAAYGRRMRHDIAASPERRAGSKRRAGFPHDVSDPGQPDADVATVSPLLFDLPVVGSAGPS